MEIVLYPHPALRYKSSDITQIDESLRSTVREMFDLMYAAKGIGLAANQVALPLRVFITNLTGETDEPSEELVFINPEIINRRGSVMGEEGCLSLPGLYADVRRANEIVVEAFDLDGNPFRAKLKDLPARVVQHEADHLDGIMFMDRLEEGLRRELEPKIYEFVSDFRRRQELQEIGTDEELLSRLEQLAESPG